MTMLRLSLMWLLLATVFTPSIAATPDSKVGMTVDVRGSARLVNGENVKKLELLAYLTPGARIEVDAGASTSISLYATKSVYQIKGPAVVQIVGNELRPISGNAPEARSLAHNLVASAQPQTRVHGAVRMRDSLTTLALVTPENGSVLLRVPSAFHWESTLPGPYGIALFDASALEVPLLKTQVLQTTWVVERPVLQPGHEYQWAVTVADGASTAAANFSVASVEVVELLASIRPGFDAPVEEWVLYATALQEHGVRDEARDAWKTIAQKRPDLTKARHLAR